MNGDRILWIATLLLLAVAGCSGGEKDREQAKLGRLKTQLRSLPYAGFSDSPGNRPGGVVRHEADLSDPGYNLYVTRALSRADLIDGEGRTLRTWHDPEFDFWQDFELLPDGTFLVVGRRRSAERRNPFEGRALLKLSWAGTREVIPLDAHHEILAAEGRPPTTLLFDLRTIPEQDERVPVLDNRIATLAEDGSVVKSLSLYDVLHDAPGFEMQEVKPTRDFEPHHIDLFHTNTLQWIAPAADHPVFAGGDLLVTMRHQDVVAVLDWDTGSLVWSWGRGELSGPHDGTLLENGNILIFDNGLGREWSRVVEVDPATGRIVWEYRDPEPKNFYTLTRGTCQRLPNGNTLIAESNEGRVIEVTPAGGIVWEFLTPHRDRRGHAANIIRMKRYPAGFFAGLEGVTEW